jgi:hypothetical protein
MRNPQSGRQVRCYRHGGSSTGARSAEGLARIAAANFRHGRYTKQAKAAREQLRSKLDALKKGTKGNR